MATRKKTAPAASPVEEGIVGRDLYVRFNDGPVQCVRVWDAALYLATHEKRGKEPKKKEDRYTISVSTRAEYMSERRAA